MTPEQLAVAFKDYKDAQNRINDDLKDLAKASLEKNQAGVSELSSKIEKVAKEVEASATRLVDLEQKTAKAVLEGKAENKSLGMFVASSNEYKAFAQNQGGKFRMQTKLGFGDVMNNTITGQSGSPAANSDVLVAPDRLSGIIAGAFRVLRVADVIPQGQTNSNMVEFTRELVFTNAAAETAEGETKPESSVTFESANAPVATIAHWLKISRQVLSDSPALASYIDNRLRYGVQYRIDYQLINGNGTGQNIKGLIHANNRTAFTPESGDTAIDSVNRAKQALAEADYPATALMMNPADWGAIERLKDTTNRYLVGDPFGAIIPTLWGLPVVVTNAMPTGKLLIGAMNIAAQIFNREGVAIEMTDSNDTDFVQNLLTLRAEARLALAGFRPASLLYGSLTL
jgi:HK97 family phage major capsid protein